MTQNHDLLAEDAATLDGLRTILEPNKGKMRGPAARPIFDDIMSHTPSADGVNYEEATIAGVSGWWCVPAGARAHEAIVHLHGGWFVWGSAGAYRHLTGQIATASGAAAFVADYRLSPEHPFPAALDDALALYDGIVELGFQRIAIVGDSAGGALAAGLLTRLRDRGANSLAPAAAVLLSPVTDLTLSGATWESRSASDLYFTRDQVAELIALYLNGQDPTLPTISPLFEKLHNLPPIRVHVGDAEMLLDDSLRFVERAAAAGVDARADVWQGMQHVFPGSVATLTAARLAMQDIGAFLSHHLVPLEPSASR
jgi:monoterpene epsilon-lactone hydrolase